MAPAKNRSFAIVLTVVLSLVAALGGTGVAGAAPPPGNPGSVRAGQKDSAIPGRLIVLLKPGASTDDLRGTLAQHGARVDRSLGHGESARIKLPQNASSAAVLAALRANAAVEAASLDLQAKAFDTPTDPGWPPQWDMQGGTGGINVAGAWSLSPSRGAGVTVAVIDTGVAYEDYSGGMGLFGPKTFKRAPDFAGVTFVAPWDWIDGDAHANDEHGHGTHVTSTIAEAANNGIAEAGISAANIMPLRILDYSGNGSASDLIDAIYYAADHGANVINMSLGFSGTGSPDASGNVCTEIAGLGAALNYADAMGVTVVAASGNDGVATVACPAAWPTVIAVGATRYDGAVTFYSNGGTALSVTAPGGDPNVDQNHDGVADQVTQQTYCLDAFYLLISGSYSDFCDVGESGTSMASPHVAGTAALLIGQLSTLSPAQVRQVLQATARDGGAPGWDPQFGYGIIDAQAAMASIIANPPPPPPPGPAPIPRPAPQPGATNVAAAALSASSIKVTWTDNATNESGFQIDRSVDGGASWQRASSVGANVTTFTNYGLIPATEYRYRVRSYDALGTSIWSTIATAFTYPPPSAPSDVTATVLGASSVRLNWTDTSSTEQGFKVERSTDGVTFTTAAYASANATTATAGSLTAATTYWFRVRAYDGSVNGPPSAAVTATTLPPPSAPSGVTATAKNTTSIRIDWTDTSTSETGFRVDRSQDGGSTWSQAALVGANTVTWTNYNLVPGTQYWFRVRAYDGSVNGDYSSVATATTLPPPAAPSGLTASATGTTSVHLTWVDNSTYEQGFKIERSSDGGLTWSSPSYASANATAFDAGSLIAATAYLFRVRAYEGATNGDYSNVAAAATLAPPSAPSGLVAQAMGTTSIKLTWTNTSSIQAGLKVERSLNGTTWTQVTLLSATATSWTNGSLVANTQYFYRIRAYQTSTDGPYSDVASATTFPPPAAPTGLTATALGTTSVKLTWVDNCTYEGGYRVERSLDGVTWTSAATLGANTTSWTNYGLVTHTAYYYRVRAFESTTNGDYSAVVTVTTP